MQYIPGIKELLQIIAVKLTAFSCPIYLFMCTAITLRITEFKWRLWTESLKNLVHSGQVFFVCFSFFNIYVVGEEVVQKGRGLLKRKRGDGGSEIRRRLAILVLSEEREREWLSGISRPTDVLSDKNFIDFVPYFD